MPTITTLIINELRSDLGHNPDKQELDALSAFLENRNINYLVDLEIAIMDWKHTQTTECAWCGDRFLTGTMLRTKGNECFCCEQCKKDYEEEHGRTI